jgi:hypothetical protein
VAVAALGLMATAVPGQAAPAEPSTPAVTAVRVGMELDCVHMSAQARAYADAHGYCAGATTAPGTVTPLNRTHGDCGDSWLYLTRIGIGVGRFTYGFLSSLGAVTFRTLSVGRHLQPPSDAMVI